jgi:maltose O-acetyltransferase
MVLLRRGRGRIVLTGVQLEPASRWSSVLLQKYARASTVAILEPMLIYNGSGRRKRVSFVGRLNDVAASVKGRLDSARQKRRWNKLRALGMHIGNDVLLSDSLQVDGSHAFLISIGDHCGFGPDVLILAHDAQMDEFIDAARIGRVILHESCHIGARTVILPGVEIGPRTIVGAGSVVAKSLPPDTVCAGSPAKVICSLDEYLDRHRRRLSELPTFDYVKYDIRFIDEARRGEMVAAVATRDGYMVGGRSAELRGEGGTRRT